MVLGVLVIGTMTEARLWSPTNSIRTEMMFISLAEATRGNTQGQAGLLVSRMEWECNPH
jgi:hypothetical protein